jgi:hypothetical protein
VFLSTARGAKNELCHPNIWDTRAKFGQQHGADCGCLQSSKQDATRKFNIKAVELNINQFEVDLPRHPRDVLYGASITVWDDLDLMGCTQL